MLFQKNNWLKDISSSSSLNTLRQHGNHVYAPDSFAVLSSVLTSKLWLSMSKEAVYFYSHAYREPKWHPKDFSPLIACSHNSWWWHHSCMGVFSKTSTSFFIATHRRRDRRPLSIDMLFWNSQYNTVRNRLFFILSETQIFNFWLFNL